MSWTRSAWLEKVEEVEGENEEKKQTLWVNIKRWTMQHFHSNYRVDEGEMMYYKKKTLEGAV